MKTVEDTSPKFSSRKLESNIRIVISVILLIGFLISLGYWCYEIYNIYTTDIINIQNIGEVWHYISRQFVAFEAAILSFLLFIAALKI